MNLGRSLHFFCVRHPWRTPKLHRYCAILAALRGGKPFREHPSSIPLRFLTIWGVGNIDMLGCWTTSDWVLCCREIGA